MGFSKEIKEQVFVASARRCCVCKEFVGRNIEVHHIIQASNGGEDTYENAIPLCFDCHANAGHYNSKHPRGSKFSPEELRKQRDQWYKLVESGQFSLNGLELSQQFFLTNSFDIVTELINGDFTNFPINEVKLYQNELFYYLKEIDVFSKRESDFCNYYKSLEEYKSRFPDALLQTDKYGPTFWTRTPSLDEIKEKFYNSEYVANYMIRNNASPADFSKATFTEYGCADCNYERFDLKEAKVVFLAIFNSSNRVISIKKIKESFIGDGGFTSIDEQNLPIREKDTNDLQLEPGKCFLVPYCILLSDLEDDYHPDKRLTYNHLNTGQGQDVRPVELLDGNKSITIGIRNFLRQVQFEQDNFLTNYSLKTLDTKNLLLISRFWECGSCPHLFGRKNESQKWEYICEVFHDAPDIIQEFVFTPKVFDFDTLKVVELENEITEIESIIVDEAEISENLKLKKGDEYTISVANSSLVKIRGKYSLIDGEKYVHNTKMKRQKIMYYMADN